jgi:urease accessory protein
MLILTKILPHDHSLKIDLHLPLTAEQRTKSRQRLEIELELEGEDIDIIHLKLPRGTLLHEGDILTDENGKIMVKIIAKSEPIITVKAQKPLDLFKAAYHLGNRHIPLEINLDYLRFSPDSVLVSMLEQLGLELTEEIAPFYPEIGAYKHDHH